MNSVVLDSSAFIALINKEEGADLVALHIPNAIMSCVNLSEVVSFFEEAGMQQQEMRMLTRSLLAERVLFDADQAFLAANFRSITRAKGLGLGDRACLSLAKIRNLPLLTADRAWATIAIGVDIKIIR
jgi:ribonuclease VapC